jgi:DNA-binding NarL/FixJ family response regulator
VLHETTTLGRILAGDPHAQRLRDELARAAQAACAPVSPRTKAQSDTLGDAAYRDVRTAAGRYSIRAVAITGRVVDLGPVVLVALERVTPTPLGDAELQMRYWLTEREIQVARLMAAGFSNPQIARRLGTSTHTARRHSERVLMKLGVHRRAEVAAKLHTR